jgi:hypothetical protein
MTVVDTTEAKWFLIKNPTSEKLGLLLLQSTLAYFYRYIVVIPSLNNEIYAVLRDLAKP